MADGKPKITVLDDDAAIGDLLTKYLIKKVEKKEGSKREGVSVIDENLCTGCGLCRQICKFEAIS